MMIQLRPPHPSFFIGSGALCTPLAGTKFFFTLFGWYACLFVWRRYVIVLPCYCRHVHIGSYEKFVYHTSLVCVACLDSSVVIAR